MCVCSHKGISTFWFFQLHCREYVSIAAADNASRPLGFARETVRHGAGEARTCVSVSDVEGAGVEIMVRARLKHFIFLWRLKNKPCNCLKINLMVSSSVWDNSSNGFVVRNILQLHWIQFWFKRRLKSFVICLHGNLCTTKLTVSSAFETKVVLKSVPKWVYINFWSEVKENPFVLIWCMPAPLWTRRCVWLANFQGRYQGCKAAEGPSVVYEFYCDPAVGCSESDINFWFRITRDNQTGLLPKLKSPEHLCVHIFCADIIIRRTSISSYCSSEDGEAHWCMWRNNLFPEDLAALPDDFPLNPDVSGTAGGLQAPRDVLLVEVLISVLGILHSFV